MDPVRRLNDVQLQDPLPKSLDLTQQISGDLVKKMTSRSGCGLGTYDLCSPRSDYAYEPSCVPLTSLLQNGFTHEPIKMLMTATGNFQSDGASEEVSPWRCAGERRERYVVGLRDSTSERSPVRFPTVKTLSSECSGHVQSKSVSSADSGVIEVPISNGTSLSLGVSENQKRGRERTENCSPILMEYDVPPDSDSLESRTVPSTSEAENADSFKPTQNDSELASLSLVSQRRLPETNKHRNQQRKRSSAGKMATASAAKRRKKKFSPPSSGFSLHSPEIKLKYASCKEEKREGRGCDFAPYVRMELSACTVVNFEEDGEVQAKKQQRQTTAATSIVPSTSCLQLMRLGSSDRYQTGELCCLCGRTASAAGLGDLHGPYLSCGADGKTSADLLINGHTDDGVEGTHEVRERWVHEDCGVWSAGVFLVKGRLYGLEEAVRLAQETVCSCCLTRGAMLGCFYKSCPNKYHFPCAVQAGCVFNEENFTLRCPKHKNKSEASANRLQNKRRCKDGFAAHQT